MILQAKNISFRYKNSSRQILEKLTLSVDSSERLGLTAPSGFGKTTLCKIIAGYEKSDEGVILLDEKPLSSYKKYCPVQMIWQNPEHSVNPRLKMKHILAEGNNIEPRIIEGLGIEKDWLNRYPTEISGGELQRFCIARVLGEGTKFILADEISTMLDLITQSQLWNFLIEETERRNIGLFIVSHSPTLLEKICTRQIENVW